MQYVAQRSHTHEQQPQKRHVTRTFPLDETKKNKVNQPTGIVSLSASSKLRSSLKNILTGSAKGFATKVVQPKNEQYSESFCICLTN